MKAAGIIVEYNPFHNGHRYHLAKTRKLTGCEVLVAVMSGNFVQRGEPALVDKFQRATAAIQNGVDLVIELPYLAATQSARQFAESAVHLLDLAKVQTLVFGSESNDLNRLKEIAEMSFNVDSLKEALHAGEGYARAYSLGSTVMQPNDILGVAYCKALKNTAIQPLCIARTTYYHDEQLYGSISSASAIRRGYVEHRDISQDCAMLIHEPTVHWAQFFPLLRALLTLLPDERLKSTFLFNEGIENHLRSVMQDSESWEDFLTRAVNRRYTRSRIQRTCLQLLNGVTQQEAAALKEPNTLRILAMNETGQRYLKFLKKEEVSIASRFAQVPQEWRQLELRTTRIYSNFMTLAERKRLIELEIGGALRFIQEKDGSLRLANQNSKNS